MERICAGFRLQIADNIGVYACTDQNLHVLSCFCNQRAQQIRACGAVRLLP